MRTRQQKGTGHKGKKDEENDTEADDSTDDAYDPARDSDTEKTSSKDDSSAVKCPATKRKLSASLSKVKFPPATETTSSPSASPNVSGVRSHHQTADKDQKYPTDPLHKTSAPQPVLTLAGKFKVLIEILVAVYSRNKTLLGINQINNF